MILRDFLAIYISKFIILISRIFKGGSNFPGKVALKISPNIFAKVSKDYELILITGTNGKTTTTSMIASALKNLNYSVITNATGANLYTGITSTFIKNYKPNKNKKNYAIIEVDEANLKFITKYKVPKIIVITNLFRDQLDRYGEIYTTLNKILEGINDDSTLLLLNGEEPLLNNINTKNPKKFFGLNLQNDKEIDINAEGKFCVKCKEPYKYNFISYNHLGDYYCENCGYKRPHIDYLVDEVLDITSNSSSFKTNNNIVNLKLGGLYNIYNAISSYATLKEIGLLDSEIVSSLETQENSFGRQEEVQIGKTKVKIILVKNPAGYNEALNTISLSENNKNIAFLLNDNYADGRDISWIYDVNFESLKSLDLENVYISGKRLYDMAIRLKIAGIKGNYELFNTNEDLIYAIENSNCEFLYILATYTAMTELRKYLYSSKYIKKLW